MTERTTTLYVRSPEVLWRATFDRVIVLVPSTGEWTTLAGTGMELWAALDEPRLVGDVAASLAELYGSPTREVERDIAATVLELAERGVLRRVQ